MKDSIVNPGEDSVKVVPSLTDIAPLLYAYMATKSTRGANVKTDPDKWKTGNEPPTDAQLAYLTTLARQVGVDIKTTGMTKADVAKKIEELQQKTGR